MPEGAFEMSDYARDMTRFQLNRLGIKWDCRIRQLCLNGRSPAFVAKDFGLELETVDAVLRCEPRKRKVA